MELSHRAANISSHTKVNSIVINILNYSIKSLRPRARSFHQHFFITDNSSVHKTRLVNAWFENHNIHRVFLPTYRPQYNAIESVWHEIKYRVKRSEPTSHASLQRAAIDAIDDVSMTTIRKHIHHVRTEINNTTVEI